MKGENMRTRKDRIGQMQRNNITICEYCGARKEGLSFCIGASREPDWTMHEGTGKMACPACHKIAKTEAQSVIDRM